MFKHIVRVNMPKQGKKSNGLEKKNAVVKYRIGEMLQHSTCFKKKKKKCSAVTASRFKKY